MTSWIPVAGYEARYEVSEDGRVRTNGKHSDGRQFPAKELKQHMQNGYLIVDLWKNGKATRKYVHRLVLESFTLPCPMMHECNHRDGKKANSHLSNLEWVTRVQNSLHAIAHGLRPRTTTGCFKKGRRPWNAGRKTGQIPWNYRKDRSCSTPGCKGDFFCREKCERCHRRSRYLAEHKLLPNNP